MSGKILETHRSFVNTWECDENEHMNVQFYVKRFEEAGAVAGILFDLADYESCIRTRHIRYHRELASAASTRVRSAFIGPVEGGIQIVHQLIETGKGFLAATALDTLQLAHPAELIGCDPEFIEPAQPRGLSPGIGEMVNSDRYLATGQAIVSNWSVMRPFDLDENGRMLASRIVSRFTDGAPHIWDAIGVTTEWLNASRFGRVAVEMKITPLETARPGTVLRLVSWCPDVSGKTFLIAHQLEDADSGQVLALGEVRSLVMNLVTRRAVSPPEIDGRLTA